MRKGKEDMNKTGATWGLSFSCADFMGANAHGVVLFLIKHALLD